MLFATLAINESFKAVFNPISTEYIKFLPIHCFYSNEKPSVWAVSLIRKHKHFVLRRASGRGAPWEGGRNLRTGSAFLVRGRSAWNLQLIYGLLNPE